MTYWNGYVVVLIIGSALLLTPFFLTRRSGRPSGRLSTLVENISLALLVFFLTFMAVEFFFKAFFAQSDGFRYTLASQNWFDRYWQENALGYRDVEWTPQAVAGKTKVIVIGDSFPAGNGIVDPENRFVNRLGQLLGDDYAVMLVASPGWDTVDQMEALVEYPYAPDMLILSYYINDIEGAAYESGLERPQIRTAPPAWLGPLVENSYAVNFLYWRLIRLGPQEWSTIYWNDWLKKISGDPEVRWRHQQQLLTLVKGVSSEGIPLFVVVFPSLTAVDESQPLLQPVIDLFAEQEIPLLDVSTLIADQAAADIVVNAVDAHPNEWLHQIVAEHLYQMVKDHEAAR